MSIAPGSRLPNRDGDAPTDPRGIKVAVLFYGLPRASAVCMPSIEQNVLQVLRAEPAVSSVTEHFHLYAQSSVLNERSHENGSLDPRNYDWFSEKDGLLASPDEPIHAEAWARMSQFGDAFGDGSASTRNLVLQLHSVQQVANLAAKEAFDVAIFLRPDLLYHDALPIRAVRFAARHEEAVVLPDWQWWHGCNDRFAICGRRAAMAYGKRWAAAEEFCQSTGQALNGEQLVQYVIRKERLKLRVMRMRASRIRINGVARSEEFRPLHALYGGRPARYRMRLLKLISSFV